MAKNNSEQNCFVISPIGQAGSDIRRHADRVLNYVIRRSLEPLGFQVIRADAISEPGTINLQVLKRIVDSEMVIADLTGTNPNVMYELAIRHAIQKPVILLIKVGEPIPFDIAAERTIFYDLGDIESVDKARDELARQAQFIQKNEFKIDTPFSLIKGLLSAPKSPESDVNSWAIALDDIGFIKSVVKKILDGQADIETGQKEHKFQSLAPKWKKIRIEYPSKDNINRHDLIDISSDQSIQDVLNEVYFLLRDSQSSSFKPDAFTHLWDWVLVRKKDDAPLLIKGIQHQIIATDLFSDGETWQVVILDKPLINKSERFKFQRGKI